MPNIEAANPENDVFGNVRGVVGDTFQVTRGQDKLQTGTDRLRLASHAPKLAFKDTIAVFVDNVVALEHFASHFDVAGNERAEALADQVLESDDVVDKYRDRIFERQLRS